MKEPFAPVLIERSELPRPITHYVIKIASRCNLNCSYCYMYNLADQTYLQQPTVMSREVVDATISRIREHALRHGEDWAGIVFHGGEPLLAGEEFFRYFVETVRARLEPEITPVISMQTNGTLLSKQWLDLLVELGINFGISLDGPREVHDAHRVDHQGKGSYDRIAEAIQRMREHPMLSQRSRNVLSVINVASDPLEVYRHFRELGLNKIDFLVPDGNYDTPPPGITVGSNATPYADWLIPIFDEWFADKDGEFVIRFFENIISLIFGIDSSTLDIGGRKSSVVIIETDGGIEPLDVLKACGDGFTKMGLNVLTNQIDDVHDMNLFRMYLEGVDHVSSTCKECPIVDVCGGGYVTNRYSSENGFDNPSIYCKDLMKIITYIQEKTINSLPPKMRAEMQLGSLAEIGA